MTAAGADDAVTTDPRAPVVSVVVATHQRAALLPRLIAALEAQTYPEPYEVVVVDDGSRDDTWAVLERLGREHSLDLRPHRLPENRGPAVARNVGWRLARGRLVAFTDDDCTPQPGWLLALCDVLRERDIVQGTTVPDPRQAGNLGPFSHTMRVEGENGFYETCNVAYRREILERVGGFDERFRHPYGEDVDLAWRAKEAGATTGFASDALILHDVRPADLRAHLRDLRRRTGVVLLTRAHPTMRPLLHRNVFFRKSHPPALLAAAGLAAAAWAPRRRLRAAAVALAAPYILHRSRHGLPGAPPPRLQQLPLAFVSDLAEISVLAVASVRVGTLVL